MPDAAASCLAYRPVVAGLAMTPKGKRQVDEGKETVQECTGLL
jgi:hypothetical protein